MFPTRTTQKNYGNIYINIPLDGLVCSIAEYLNELRRILTSPWGKSKYKQRQRIQK